MYRLFITQEQLNYVLRQWIISNRERGKVSPGKQDFYKKIAMKEYERYRVITRGRINEEQERKLNEI